MPPATPVIPSHRASAVTPRRKTTILPNKLAPTRLQTPNRRPHSAPLQAHSAPGIALEPRKIRCQTAHMAAHRAYRTGGTEAYTCTARRQA
jgi:hypothetical protein